jgi:hypothetical protein
MNTKLKSLFVFKSADKIIVNPVTVFITVDNESMIVIISNSFTKSEWCQWEVDIIQERRRRQGRDAVLIIMLKTTLITKHAFFQNQKHHQSALL